MEFLLAMGFFFLLVPAASVAAVALIGHRLIMRQRRRHQEKALAAVRPPLFLGPQVVGQICPRCGVKIAMWNEAYWCDHCDRAVHHACDAAHLSGESPYR